ncbi:MAG: DUF1565 domain-containing protein, partial [Terriglobales bacterium]
MKQPLGPVKARVRVFAAVSLLCVGLLACGANTNAAYKTPLTLTVGTTAPTDEPTQPPPTGSSYYVASSGSDSNNGSEASPWATIQHAANIVGPGAIVIVADGTYSDSSAVGP